MTDTQPHIKHENNFLKVSETKTKLPNRDLLEKFKKQKFKDANVRSSL